MVGKISGRDVPACGFSIGFERIIGILTDRQFTPPSAVERLALIYDADRDDLALVAQVAADLRDKGYAVVTQAKKKTCANTSTNFPPRASRSWLYSEATPIIWK